MNDPNPTEAERYPTLSEEGRRMLQFLREHPSAPMFRNESGNRLSTQDLEKVRAFDDEVRAQAAGWPKGEVHGGTECHPTLSAINSNALLARVLLFMRSGGMRTHESVGSMKVQDSRRRARPRSRAAHSPARLNRLPRSRRTSQYRYETNTP